MLLCVVLKYASSDICVILKPLDMTSLRMTSAGFSVGWLSRMFVDALPFSVTLRIFDTYVHQGCDVHLMIGLSLLKNAKDSLLACRSEHAFLGRLRDTARAISTPAKLFEKAWKFKVSKVLYSYMKQVNKLAASSQVKKAKSGASTPTVVALPSGSSNSVPATPKLQTFFPTLKFKSRIMAESDWNWIYNWMPHRFTIQDPVLLHSMDHEGTSLQLIYKTLSTHEPTLVVVKSKQERVR